MLNVFDNIKLLESIVLLPPKLQKRLERHQKTADEDAFLIEKVLDRRKSSRSETGFEFLIKWLGYPEPTWERLENLDDPKIIARAHKAFDENKKEHVVIDTSIGLR
jgi:hypothetical protein